MKKVLCVLFIAACFVFPKVSIAQADELAQLALNIEKLAQFKQILSDLKKGYQILSGGYNTIKNISQGNFELHKLFLDGLYAVNPKVRDYKRVGDIISFQLSLLKEYKAALKQFRSSGFFNPGELDYMEKVYGNLFSLSLKNLDDLVTVLTANKLRMNDEERLAAIDKVYEDMSDKLRFLRSFNRDNHLLALQRAKEKADIEVLKSIYK